MRLSRIVVTLAALGSLALPALAQEPLAAPPVLRVTVEDIKPGSMGAHDKSVASYLALFSRAQVPMTRIGIVPVSGDQNRVLYLEGYPSYAELEAADKKVEAAFAGSPTLAAELETLDRNGGPLHSSQRSMIAVFRPDLSYRPMTASVFSKSRYFGVATLRIKLGHVPDYEAYLKQLNQAREKGSIDESTAVYQVTSGTQAGTFMTFTANRALAELDAARAGMAARNKAVDDALGGEQVVRQRRETVAAIVVDATSALYSINPKLGAAPPQIAAGDPDFWTPKVTGKALAAKEETKKK
jgi:hypothetical protein